MTARPASQNPAPAPAATKAATTARQGGAGYTLAQLIERWHAANPDFSEFAPDDPETRIWSCEVVP